MALWDPASRELYIKRDWHPVEKAPSKEPPKENPPMANTNKDEEPIDCRDSWLGSFMVFVGLVAMVALLKVLYPDDEK